MLVLLSPALVYGLLTVPLVRDHLASNLLTLDESDTLRESARLLKSARITGAPVLDGSSLSGILSRNDMLRAIDRIPLDIQPDAFEEQLKAIQEQEVWQVMASSPVTISPDASLLDAAKAMCEGKLNRLMVKAQYSAMLGILSSTDVVFALLGCDATAAEGIDPAPYMHEPDEINLESPEECTLGAAVSNHMATSLVVMSPEMCLKDAARLLRAARITGAPVVDACGKLCGVVSRNDLLKAIFTKIPQEIESAGGEAFARAIAKLEAESVENIMSPSPITIPPSASMLEVAKILAKEKLNRLLVTDQTGVLRGIISSTDVVFVMLGCDYSMEEDGEEDNDDIDLRRIGNMYRKGIY